MHLLANTLRVALLVQEPTPVYSLQITHIEHNNIVETLPINVYYSNICLPNIKCQRVQFLGIEHILLFMYMIVLIL